MTKGLYGERRSPGVLPWLIFAAVLAAVAVISVWIPLDVIRPFRPEDPGQLRIALRMHDVGPWLAGLCAVLVTGATIWSWNGVREWTKRMWFRTAMVSLSVLAIAAAVFTHVNLFEKMFHPYDSPAFENADSSSTEPAAKVLAVQLGGQARAYPILTMGYHHIVNDTVGGVPIAMTYCTLCHTGIAWDPMLDGRRLHFRLAGINNGNALLRDEETKSVWQQSTGEAIFGPLQGRHLKMIHSDEMSFALWHREQPNGDVR